MANYEGPIQRRQFTLSAASASSFAPLARQHVTVTNDGVGEWYARIYVGDGSSTLAQLVAAEKFVGNIPGGGGDPDLGSILYVATTGDDDTGERGNPHKPFATIKSALIASSEGDVIRVDEALTLDWAEDVVADHPVTVYAPNATIQGDVDGYLYLSNVTLYALRITGMWSIQFEASGAILGADIQSGDDGVVVASDGVTEVKVALISVTVSGAVQVANGTASLVVSNSRAREVVADGGVVSLYTVLFNDEADPLETASGGQVVAYNCVSNYPTSLASPDLTGYGNCWACEEGGGGGVWGSITGDIADQEDLANALLSKAPNHVDGNVLAEDAGQSVANGTYLRNDNASPGGLTPTPGSKRWINGVVRLIHSGAAWWVHHVQWGNLYTAPGAFDADPTTLSWEATDPSHDPPPSWSPINTTVQGAFDEVRSRIPSVLFTDLPDAPGSYAGAANKHVAVNNSETGLVFVDPPVQATTTTAGLVELATSAETIAGTDTERAVTPAGLAATRLRATLTVDYNDPGTSTLEVTGTRITLAPNSRYWLDFRGNYQGTHASGVPQWGIGCSVGVSVSGRRTSIQSGGGGNTGGLAPNTIVGTFASVTVANDSRYITMDGFVTTGAGGGDIWIIGNNSNSNGAIRMMAGSELQMQVR